MPTLEDRDRYAGRVAELRAMAETARDPDIRKTLNEMITSYDKLVEQADHIANLRGRVRTV